MTTQPNARAGAVPQDAATPTNAPVLVEEAGLEEEPDGPTDERAALPVTPTGRSVAPTRLAYRLLTGPDDTSFCARISAALDDGYRLYGSPAATFDGQRVIVAQAVVRADVTDQAGA